MFVDLQLYVKYAILYIVTENFNFKSCSIASRKRNFMNNILFVPYPAFSDDKKIYFKLEILETTETARKVIGNCSSIFVRATLTEKEHFSYFNPYLYDEEEAVKKGIIIDDEDALKECSIVAEAIWG